MSLHAHAFDADLARFDWTNRYDATRGTFCSVISAATRAQALETWDSMQRFSCWRTRARERVKAWHAPGVPDGPDNWRAIY